MTRACAEHFWPGQSAIGKRFRFFDEKRKPSDWITVVRASANIIQELNEKSTEPLMFVPFQQEGWNRMALLVRSATMQSPRCAPCRASIRICRCAMFTCLERFNVGGGICTSSAGFLWLRTDCVADGGSGLLRRSSQRRNNRTQEIGVRMALGANARNIVSLVMWRSLWQILAGLGFRLAQPYLGNVFSPVANRRLSVRPSSW